MNNAKCVTLDYVCKEIKTKKQTLVLCHRNPDPDTLGSAFALKHLLEFYGSCVTVACADKYASKFSFITGGADLTLSDKEYERIIAVDVASPAQLGALEYLHERVNLIIDHHAMNTRFANYYEELCSSCAEIIYIIGKRLGVLKRIDKHFFDCVYAGMTSDTGGFRYSSVTPRTMNLASEILGFGIDHAEINRIIFEAKTMGEIKAQRLAYENMRLYSDGALAIVSFSNKTKEENGILDEDIGDIVNTVRGLEGVLVAISLKQASNENNKYFISSRSNAEIDVSEVCSSLGGGGHKRAAGASISASSEEEAISACRDAFLPLVEKYKENRK